MSHRCSSLPVAEGLTAETFVTGFTEIGLLPETGSTVPGQTPVTVGPLLTRGPRPQTPCPLRPEPLRRALPTPVRSLGTHYPDPTSYFDTRVVSGLNSGLDPPGEP